MINKELKERIITSIILLSIISLGIFIHLYLSLIVLVVISILTWREFVAIIEKINFSKKLLHEIFKILSFCYLSVFAYTSFVIIASNKLIFIYFLIVCIFSDIGGYIIGKIFGGLKLTKISPNKTISGSMGSFFFSLAPSIIIYLFFKYDSIEKLILISLWLSLICQLGDLFISYFKRLANVKNTGNILPGHGGILDRIDGIIFAIPSLILLNYFI